MSTKVYIAGPMTGIEDWNYPAFNAAQERLEACGYSVMNPAAIDTYRPHKPRMKPVTWEDWMRNALDQVIRADGIAMLPGWYASRGARLENYVAEQLGIPSKLLDEWCREHESVGELEPLPFTPHQVRKGDLIGYSGAGQPCSHGDNGQVHAPQEVWLTAKLDEHGDPYIDGEDDDDTLVHIEP